VRGATDAVVAAGGVAYLARMRAFAWFLAAISVAIAGAALLAYPAYQLIHPHVPEWWFDKIGSRLFDLLLLCSLVFVVRHLRLRTRRDWGYGAPRPRWIRQFLIGLAAGIATMLPVTVSMLVLGVRVPEPGLTPALLGHALLVGVASGLTVGFVEETFFRGLMLGAVLRDLRRPLLAIVLVSAVFASLHFLASTRIPHEAVRWNSGLELLRAAFANFAAPATIIDRLLSLFAVGVLLGLAAWWTGSIALGVGLHAGWVTIMRATVGATHEDAAAPLAWLISRSDGYTGWLVLGWTLLLILAVVVARGRFRSWRRSA
jgi:membrane protease YdiL (CAAX protease family)